jgi:putative FmdB family regulatory protein
MMMPIYDYKCQDGHKHTQLRRITEPGLTVCPECKKELRRVFTAPAVVFKGDGFYSNDKNTTLDINLD